jgi:transcriptional regulator with PAS, ATPase and Fis domain
MLQDLKEQFLDYGLRRCLEPKDVLPTTAWRLDNSQGIYPEEVRVSLKNIMIESTSFKQVCVEANNETSRIQYRIKDIISKRGKFHNPVTDTGGLLFGVVEEIGENYDNKAGVKVGDHIICNSSLASIPLYIDKINSIDRTYSFLGVEGYGIVFNGFPIVKYDGIIPINLLMYALNESGTLYMVNKYSKNKEDFLIVGDHLISNLMFGYAIKKNVGDKAHITCLLDRKSEMKITGGRLQDLMDSTFENTYYDDILNPLECVSKLKLERKFDLAVNCADIPGGETINVMAAKDGGSIFFANMINNYNTALYVTEAISREVDVKGAGGYLHEYADFDLDLVKEIAPYFDGTVFGEVDLVDDMDYPLGREHKSMEQAGYRKSLAEDFICESRSMMPVLKEIMSVAKYDCNVLILGDTGVGKEKVATIIHKNSTRNMQNFVKVNCAAIAPNLLESEFFGYEKGAFTGATAEGKEGFFEIANNGIMFLDEVSELPFDLQAKLLRVIQDGEFYRVGGTKPIKTNVRILSATNKDLMKLVESGKFRNDLFYRLNVFPIKVPPLSERRTEIPPLAKHFLKKYTEKFGVKKEISNGALDALKEHEWKGNIRELENMIQRILISTQNDRITVMDVTKNLNNELLEDHDVTAEDYDVSDVLPLKTLVDDFEGQLIAKACDKYGSTRKAAKALGISQTQLVRKRKKTSV